MARSMTELDAAAALGAGDVVAAATESSYGLLADIGSPSALDRLFALKPRELGRGVPVLLPSRRDWEALVGVVAPVAERLALRFWPGPLTLALPARPGVVDPRLLVDGTLAVRVAGPSAAARLAAQTGLVLTATSANRPGESPALDSDAAQAAFDGADGGAGAAARELCVVEGRGSSAPPSTLLGWGRDGRVRLLREGAVPRSAVEAILAEVGERLA